MKTFFSEALVLFILCSYIMYPGESNCEVRVRNVTQENTYAPLNSTIYVNCMTNSEENIRWAIRFSGAELPNGFSDDEMLLNNRGFYNVFAFNNETTKRITLLINNTALEEYNNTQIICRSSEKVVFTTIIVIIEPPAINSINSKDIHLQSINISWDLLLHDWVQSYSIRVISSSNTAQPQLHQIHQPYYVFTAPDGAPPCEVYNFSVTGTYVGVTYSGAGCSVPGQVLSRMLPSLPNIERLNSSLTYSPILDHGDLMLYVSFKPGMSCEDYPILNYTLEVKSSSSPEVVTHFIAPHYHNLIGNLSENREYSFKIVAVNAVGNVSSSVREFNTADVQFVTAVFNETSNGFLVRCHFIPGSDAQGCMVVLVGESDNMTVNLTRLDTIAVEFIDVTCPPINYLRVIGYDIESDNKSIGPLAVSGRLLINNSILCPLNDHEMESSLGITTILLTCVMIPVIVTIIIIIIIIVLLVKRSNTRVFRPSQQPTLGCTNLQPPSQPKQDKEQPETKEQQQIMPLYELPKKSNVSDKDVVEDTLHSTSKCEGNNIVKIPENITTYAEITEKDPEHFYYTLENAKKVIPPDPDAPELPPPFKLETSPPPLYQDILDLRRNKGHSTLQNEYSTVST